jgi:hypothetical protein
MYAIPFMTLSSIATVSYTASTVLWSKEHLLYFRKPFELLIKLAQLGILLIGIHAQVDI